MSFVRSGPGFQTSYERKWGLWHWRLIYENRDGSVEPIADGRTLFKSSATAAAQSWIRIFLRRKGMLNY